jgi:cell wall-associated NlpC family hydrolase
MQAKQLGTPLEAADWDKLKRGDLVFWKGHVGVMCNEHTLLHANGHHMLVVQEPFQQARERISSEYGQVTQINRL